MDVCQARNSNIRFAGLVSVVGLAGLTRGDGGIIHKLEQVLSVSSDNGKLLAVLTESVELVGEGRLELLAGDVAQLSLSDKRLSLGTDELLLEDHDAGAVGLLVLELRNLIGDLLLACVQNVKRPISSMDRHGSKTYGHGWAEQKTRCCECSSW